jgi:N-acetylmuramoyl-L-alanine amidase
MKERIVRIIAYTGGISALIIFCAFGSTSVQDAASRVVRHAQAASIFFTPSITVGEIRTKYYGETPNGPATPAKKVRVLLVPGHQPNAGGAQFNGVYERHLVVDIADALAILLSQNPRFEVLVARSKTEWHPFLQSFFDNFKHEIETFRQSQASQMQEHVSAGNFRIATEQIHHNIASPQGILQLYGINTWSIDNKYDVVLHLHLNDYAGRRAGEVGRHDGFSVYVPDPQYSNAAVSKAIGEAIAVRLNAYHATSTLPTEDKGVVEDRELIAIGSNNSVDAAALLIEYGYIYEPQFREPSVREVAITDYAYQTYLGIQDFFKDPILSKYGSLSFSYGWTGVTGKRNERGAQVYALQAALRYLGYYPPAGKSFADCPISGIVGNCTRRAIETYQRAHGFEAVGILGQKTHEMLRKEFGSNLLY